MPSCPTCGKEVKAETVYCPNCGTNLQSGRVAQPAAYQASYSYPSQGTGLSPEVRLGKITKRLERLTYLVAVIAAFLLIIVILSFFP